MKKQGLTAKARRREDISRKDAKEKEAQRIRDGR
jgi:hypothetical protein